MCTSSIIYIDFMFVCRFLSRVAPSTSRVWPRLTAPLWPSFFSASRVRQACFFNTTLGILCTQDFRNTEFFPKFLSFFANFLSFFRNFGQFFEKFEYFFACLLSKSFRSIEFLSKILLEFFQKAEFFWAEFFSKC